LFRRGDGAEDGGVAGIEGEQLRRARDEGGFVEGAAARSVGGRTPYRTSVPGCTVSLAIEITAPPGPSVTGPMTEISDPVSGLMRRSELVIGGRPVPWVTPKSAPLASKAIPASLTLGSGALRMVSAAVD
jgi:hypothetical protein